MADLSAFSNVTFDPVQWIDSMLSERPEEESVDSYITALAMKLHLVSQDYTDQLEGAMVEAVAMMPRTLAEISRTQEIIKNLDTEMAELATQLYEFDQRNIAGVEDLSRLDTLKLNMEKCRATLEEHARWSQLVREARAMIESGGRLSESADRLETLNKSLEILQCMPGHEERAQTCLQLTEELLTWLRPRVVQDLLQKGESQVDLRESLYVYEKLKRTDVFLDLYTSCRPHKLARVVEQYFGGDSSAAQGSLQADQLADFYGQVQGFLYAEVQAVDDLFGPEAVPELLCIVLEKIMQPLAGPMRARYTADAFAIVDKFCCRIAPLLVGSGEADLVRCLRVCYASFLSSTEILMDSEGHVLRSDLEASLRGIHFDTRLAAPGDEFILLPDGDEASTEMDLTMFDSDDISAVFEKYAATLGVAVEQTHLSVSASIVRALSFMGGLRARQYVRFLSPVLAQHIKALLLRLEELRVGGSMPASGAETVHVSSKEDAIIARSSEEQYAVASRIAKEFRMGEMGLSKGKVLLLCALRVLQSAGSLCRCVSSLEHLATEQLDRAVDCLFAESSSLSQVVQRLVMAKAESAPELSVGGAVAAAVLKEDSHAEAELRAFLTTLTRRTASSVPQSVFPASLAPLGKFKQAAEKFLFDLATLAPEALLKDLSSEEVWAEEGDGSEEQLENMLPQQAFTQVGEHLLSLLQDLETFATSSNLLDLLQLKGDAEGLAASSWTPLRGILKLKDEDGCSGLARRSSCGATIVKAEQAMFGMACSVDPLLDGGAFSEGADGTAAEEDDVLLFVNEWLSAFADHTIGLVVVQLCQISYFSSCGLSQLSVDLEYLSNVIGALGLTPHPLLAHLLVILKKDKAKLQTQVDFMPVNSSPLDALHRLDKMLLHATTTKRMESREISSGRVNE